MGNNTDIWIPVMIAVIGFLGSVITALISYRSTKSRLRLDAKTALSEAQQSLSLATKEQVETVRSLLDTMREDLEITRSLCKKHEGTIRYLKGRMTRMTRLIRELVDGAELLVEQVEEQGLDPAWRPPANTDEIIRGDGKDG